MEDLIVKFREEAKRKQLDMAARSESYKIYSKLNRNLDNKMLYTI